MPPAKDTKIPELDKDDGWRPVPDPTVLTTQATDKVAAVLKELFEAKLDKLGTVTETRLDGMDKAIELVREIAGKGPVHTAERIDALKQVHEEKFNVQNEKFASIQTQFQERDVRIEQAAGAVKIAVDAALQAQKEAAGEQNKSSAAAIAKSETNFTKLIDQMNVTLLAGFKAADDKISAGFKAIDTQITDMKERLTRMETERRTVVETAKETREEKNSSNIGIIAGAVGAILGAAGGAIGLIALFKH